MKADDISSDRANYLNKENAFFTPGPGHTSNIPSSYSIEGKKETIKWVLTMAVIWVTIAEKYKELKAKWSTETIPTDAASYLPNGVSYRDLLLGERMPRLNEQLRVAVNMFYNGMKIQPYEFIKESRLSDTVQFEYTESFARNIESAFEVNGIAAALAGIKINSKRQIKLPAKLAFHENAIPNYIDPDSIVTVDVFVRRSENS
jgi:FKBP-type peptidyl-prolyl cis-trans isomerase